jgi:hypothetical protein
MRVRRYAIFRAALSVVVLFAALAGGARGLSQAPDSQPQGQTFYQPTGEEGMIQGVIGVEGEVLPRPLIPMEVDSVCASLNRGGVRLDDIVVERGRLANALVYVESAWLDTQTFAPRPWTPALGKRRCYTVPHVLALQAGQTLYVQNGDRTAHNYNFQTKVNPLVNRALSPGGAGFEILFKQPEPPFVVRCNQHPWERGYVAVLPHPFFTVTRGNGTFAIEGLPPGEYEVVVWHEKFKEARATVSVGVRETKVSNFTFKYPGGLR